MPIDGVSFSQVGFKIANPSEVNVQAEVTAKQEAKTEVKKLDKSHEAEAETEKNEDEGNDLQGRDTNDESNQEDDSKKLESNSVKKKKFKVKFNSSTEMVEMHDAITGELIETVTPEDLINLLSKSKIFSGIFVDRKI